MEFGNVFNFKELKEQIAQLKEKKKPKGRVFEEHVRDDIGFSSDKKPKK